MPGDSIKTAAELRDWIQAAGFDPQRADLWFFEESESQVLKDNLFSLVIPKYYANLIDWHDPHDPLRRMVVPDREERERKTYELTDPIGDHDREVVPGLIHRYKDRCLLLLTTHCLVHCRFCFRKEVVGKVRPVAFARIKQYIQTNQAIREVIFSGGDPFTYPAGFLEQLRAVLTPVDHVKVWRFHTRVPATNPVAIPEEFLQSVASFPGKVIVVCHVNHVREVTPEFVSVVKNMQAKGILVLSQTVLLKNVNSTTEDLVALFTSLLQVGVKPYYLHHLDQAPGTHHFRISLAEGKQLYRSLRQNVSPIAIPEYVLDVPGGFGKIPVMWLTELGQGKYQGTSFEGNDFVYQDQAQDQAV